MVDEANRIDICGRPIRPGDFVVIARGGGHYRAGLEIGMVETFTTSGIRYLYIGRRRQGNTVRRQNLQFRSDRVVLIDPISVPYEEYNLLVSQYSQEHPHADSSQ